MAVSAATRAEIKREIVDWLLAGGGDVESFLARFPGVPKSTFYRWLAAARVVAGREEAGQALKSAEALRRESEELREEIAGAMPIPVSVDGLMPVSNTNAMQIVQDAILMARRSAAHCESEGKIKNLRGYQQATRTLLSAVDTLCRVAERLHDIQRVEQYLAAIFEEIEAESPEVMKRIILRLIKLNEARGF